MQSAESLIGSVVGERHRLLRVIGEGGMGCVFEAADRSGTRLAVKVLRPDVCEPEDVQRFLREGSVGSRIASPHVIPIVEFGIDGERRCPYLVMPFVEGEDLESVLRRTGPLDPDAAIRIARQTALGLAAVHASGIVHRDVKPSNVFLERLNDGRIVARLFDFGLAKPIDTDAVLTRSAVMLGSPLFMSPEHLRGHKAVEFRSDIYAFGATLFAMLAGEPPFAELEDSFGALFTAIGTRECPRVEACAPWVARAIGDVVARALRRDIRERFTSAQAVADALEAIADRPGLLASDLRPARRGPGATIPLDVTLPQAPRTPEARDRFVGRVLDATYRVVRRLGHGGMGAVYEADSDARGRVAIKVIDQNATGSDERTTRRFRREAHAATEIRSEHAVRVFELRHDPTLDVPFIVMEFLEGTDLAEFVRATGAIEPSAAARIFLQAARGLAAAHRVGLVHRDIKPANLFLHRRAHASGADQIIVKVCDFGIAKRAHDAIEAASTELTRTGGMVGSPLYMSPEQAKGSKALDARSDVWSLCMSMHEALSGRRPWEGLTALGEIIVAICTVRAPLLGDVAPWVDPALAAIVDRGLSRDPTDRWPTAEALIGALETVARRDDLLAEELVGVAPSLRMQARVAVGSTSGAIKDEPSVPLGTSSSIVANRVVGRRRLAIGMAAAVALALVGAGALRLRRTGAGAEPPGSAPSAEAEAIATTQPAAPVVVDADARPPADAIATTTASAPSSSGPVAPPLNRPRPRAAAVVSGAPTAGRPSVPPATGAPAGSGATPGSVRPKETW